MGEYPQTYYWLDYSEEPSESQALNIIGVINNYEKRTTAKGYIQEFELLQPAKVESASLKLLIFSDSEDQMPIPETKGQIIYARNILKIRQNPPTFILSAMIKENRVVILNSESKARKNMDYLHPYGVMYTDGAGYYPSERRSVIGNLINNNYFIIFNYLGKRIMFGGREHLTILHIEMNLGFQLSLHQIFALANKTRGERKNKSFEINIMNFLEIILKLFEMLITRTIENATNGNLFKVGEKPDECDFCAERCDCATFTNGNLLTFYGASFFKNNKTSFLNV